MYVLLYHHICFYCLFYIIFLKDYLYKVLVRYDYSFVYQLAE